MDRVLVTGGAGFIGSNLVRHLLDNTDCKLMNLDKLTYAGNLRNIKDLRGNKRHKFVKGDIRNRKLVDPLSHKGNDLAGSCSSPGDLTLPRLKFVGFSAHPTKDRGGSMNLPTSVAERVKRGPPSRACATRGHSPV